MTQLKELRNKIDDIDKKLIGLLEKRFAISSEIWDIKKRQGYGHFDSKRESEIKKNIKELLKDEVMQEHIEKIYDTLLIQSKIYQSEKEGD
ncbi:MAG: chorismate mutase [Clostridiales bacterium]|nr:chorismate mutase [Clostridiales bacterium]